MQILGIDYGRKKMGLAVADGMLAEPYLVLHFESQEEAIRKVKQIIGAEKVKQVVLGVSEGKMAEEIKIFGQTLQKKLNTPVIFQDETLSTKIAQELSIVSGMKRKKRKTMEDAYAATIMLQSYIDENI